MIITKGSTTYNKKGISINGYKLHEVRMLMVPQSKDCVSYLSFPKNRIQFEKYEEELVLFLPSMLVVELFRTSAFPQDQNEVFPVHISGKKIGVYKVKEFRYPNSFANDSIKIILKKHSKVQSQ